MPSRPTRDAPSWSVRKPPVRPIADSSPTCSPTPTRIPASTVQIVDDRVRRPLRLQDVADDVDALVGAPGTTTVNRCACCSNALAASPSSGSRARLPDRAADAQVRADDRAREQRRLLVGEQRAAEAAQPEVLDDHRRNAEVQLEEAA